MMTIKEIMRREFREDVYNPFLAKYVDWFDILSLADGDKIEVKISEGKLDDGTFCLERKRATLYMYRSGEFNKILIINKFGIFSYTKNQFKKGSVSGAMETTHKWQRFFAQN